MQKIDSIPGFQSLFRSGLRGGDCTRSERGNKVSAEMMISDPKKSILHMVVFVALTYIAIKAKAFLDVIWIAGLGSKAMLAAG